MKLSEIVKELTRKKNDGSRVYTQTTLGVAIGTNQSAVSQMLAGRAWDDHWDVFLKLLPIAVHHGLATDPVPQSARDLNSKALAGGLINDAMGKAAGRADTSAKKVGKK